MVKASDFAASWDVETKTLATMRTTKNNDSHRTWWLISCSLLVVCFVVVAAVAYNQCSACVLSNADLPLVDGFQYSPGPGLPGSEFVRVSGKIHVVSKVDPTKFLGNLQISVAGVSGVGQTLGDLYTGVGTNKRAGIRISPGPNTFTVDFTLEPTDGCPSVPLLLKFTLNFNNDGTLNTSASSVVVGGIT